MRVATWNIRHARSRRTRSVDLAAFAAAVASLDADVLALQEVDRMQRRSGLADLTAAAAEAMAALDARFASTLTGTPGLGWQPVTGEPAPDRPAYGIALLSRLPVGSWRTVRLPDHAWRGLRDEPRLAVVADVGGLTVASTHLSFVPSWAREQLAVLATALGPDPALIAGDLNLPDPLAGLDGWRALHEGPTWPAGRPRRRLDHVLARGDAGAVARSDAIDLGLSDHRAVVVDLDRDAPA